MSRSSPSSALLGLLSHPRCRPLLRLLDRLLQLVLPVRDGRVCYLSIPDHTDNAYYVYRHAVRTRTDLEHVWLVEDVAVADRIERELAALVDGRSGHGHRLRVVKRWSPAGYLAYLTSRTVFHTHGAYAFSDTSRRRDVVAVWHGMPLKAIARLNRVTTNQHPTFATASIASAPMWRYIIACSFGLEAHEVHLTGLPRCDPLRFSEARDTSPATVRERLEIPAGHQLLLWMPTYRTSPTGRSFVDDLPAWVLPTLSRACQEHDCTVVIKLHPFDTLNDERAVIDEQPGIRVVRSPQWLDSGIQLYDLVAAADGLLSDISSIIFDYLATAQPLGLIGFDRGTYDRERLLPVDLLLASERFDALDDETALEAFVGDVGAGARRTPPAGDLARALIELPQQPSAELVLRQFDL